MGRRVAAAAALWAAALGALAALGGAADRPQIKPSLECSCRSSQRTTESLHLQCQRAGGVTLTNTGAAHNVQTEKSSFSCVPGGPSSSDEEWWFAEVHDRGAYRLSKNFLGWAQAEEECERVKEQLVALDGGEAEVKELLRAFADVAKDGNQLFWVGIRYFHKEQAFYTVRGQKMVPLPWSAGHPLIRKGQECVVVGREAKLHGPHGCNGKRRFFCKG